MSLLQIRDVLQSITLLLCLAGYLRPAWANDNTYINNRSQWVFSASTSYDTGNSQFKDRTILPGGTAVDTYSCCPTVSVTAQLFGAPYSNYIEVMSDTSVVAVDNPKNEHAVDFYKADSDGGGPVGPSLMTIYTQDVNAKAIYDDDDGNEWAVSCDQANAGSPLLSDCADAVFNLNHESGNCILRLDNWDFATAGHCSIGLYGRTGMSFPCSILASVADDLVNTCLSGGYITGGEYALSGYQNLGPAWLRVYFL